MIFNFHICSIDVDTGISWYSFSFQKFTMSASYKKMRLKRKCQNIPVEFIPYEVYSAYNWNRNQTLQRRVWNTKRWKVNKKTFRVATFVRHTSEVSMEWMKWWGKLWKNLGKAKSWWHENVTFPLFRRISNSFHINREKIFTIFGINKLERI